MVWQDKKCDVSNPETADFTKLHLKNYVVEEQDYGTTNIMLSMLISMASTQESIVITSYKVLNLFEDVGGFVGAI